MPNAANPPQAADANASAAAPQLAPANQPAASAFPAPPISAQPMPPTAPTGPVAATAPDSTAPSAPGQNFAWPNPTINPPAIPSTDGATNSAAADQTTPSDGAAGDLPAPDPLKGRIPLPRRRPNVIAMAEPAVAPGMPPVAPVMPSAMASAIPLPRARPASAPEPAASAPPEAPANGYDPGLGH